SPGRAAVACTSSTQYTWASWLSTEATCASGSLPAPACWEACGTSVAAAGAAVSSFLPQAQRERGARSKRVRFIGHLLEEVGLSKHLGATTVPLRFLASAAKTCRRNVTERKSRGRDGTVRRYQYLFS